MANDDVLGANDDDTIEPAQMPVFGDDERERVVVFADMMGFSALTHKHHVEPEVFMELQRPGNAEFLRASLEGMNANVLSERFIRFHLLVAEAAGQVRLVEDAESITFSDCAFLATGKLYAAVEYAETLMRSALLAGIPLRVGIAAGEFLVVRIRADFGMVNQDHIVQFLGSGVSMANATEGCGINGCRILLHPSAEALLGQPGQMGPYKNVARSFRTLPLPEAELANKVGAVREVGYLGHPKRHEKLWVSIKEMAAASSSDQQRHYESTKAALNRMRVDLGLEPFESA